MSEQNETAAVELTPQQQQQFDEWERAEQAERAPVVAKLKTMTLGGLYKRGEHPAAVAEYRCEVAPEIGGADFVRLQLSVPRYIGGRGIEDPNESYQLDVVGPAGLFERLVAGLEKLVAEVTQPAST